VRNLYLLLSLTISLLLFADEAEKIDKDAFSKYRRLIQSADVSQRKEAVKALANVTTKRKKVASCLISLLLVEQKDEVREAAYEVLKLCDDDDAVQVIIKALNKFESGDVRAQLMKVLWGFKRSDADEAVLRGLADPAWEVRLTVAELIGMSKAADRPLPFRKRIIEKLIKVVVVEPDKRVRNYMRGALYELTNQDFGTDKKKWEEWWEKHKARYGIPREKETDEPPTKGKIRTEVVPWEEEEAPTKPRPRFFGEEISKKRVFFVIDVSGSMSKPASDGTKLDVVKKEMKNAIQAMDETYKFNILFYNHGFKMWKPSLQKATKQIKAEAITEIDRQMPMGMTNIWASMKKAMEDGDTNLIILLSDGLPTAGITDTNKILEDVKRWNKYRKIQINTVGMQGADFDFLRKLAEQNGGKFRQAN